MDVIRINSNNQIVQPSLPVKAEDKAVKPDIQNKASADDKKEAKISAEELNSAVEKANKMLFKNNTHLKFSMHKKTNEVVVKIINDESGEVLKEIPSEKMLDMMDKLWEIAGILVDEKR